MVNPRAMRLRDFAKAVLGESELKVGPRAIASVLTDTAEFLEKQEQRKKRKRRRTPPLGFKNLRRS